MTSSREGFLHFRYTMTNIEDIYKLFLACRGELITDTRKIDNTGALFFALSGDQFNGNAFAAEAIQKGCRYAIIDDQSIQTDDRFIRVENVLSTLQELAHHHRRQFDIPVIAITGSNGKTTTKELLKACLSTDFEVLATKGNFNNHIGVPLTLLRLTKKHTIAIVEMGTNNPGEILALSKMAAPSSAIISSIGKAHLEGLGTLAGVAREKLSLFDYVRENHGFLFANKESNYILDYLEKHSPHAISYTSENSPSFYIKIDDVFPKIKGQLVSEEREYPLDSCLFGKHNLLNITAALTISTYYGVRLDKSVEAINGLMLHNNRTDTIHMNGCTYYLDAYNANPSSMVEAIKAFTTDSLDNKWLILGDMFELGEHELKEHQSIVELVEANDWHKVVLVGSLFYQTRCTKSILKFAQFDEMKAWFSQQDVASQEIFIKGSRGMGLERLLD